MSNLPPPPLPPEPPPPPGYHPPQQPPPGYGQGYGPPPGYGQGQGPPPGYGPPGAYGYAQVGVVPPHLGEIYYQPWMNILLYAITCGIWGVVWSWRTHEDLKRYNGDGLGGVAALIICLLIPAVIMFTVPNEIEKMYHRQGWQSPVSTIWGLWCLLPIIGQFIWYLKVQDALNAFWAHKGSYPAPR